MLPSKSFVNFASLMISLILSGAGGGFTSFFPSFPTVAFLVGPFLTISFFGFF